MEWAPHLLQSLSSSTDGSAMMEMLCSKMIAGVLLNTQFSGMGCAEMAMCNMMSSLYNYAGDQHTAGGGRGLTIWSACDNMGLARRVLKLRKCDAAPSHVFGDVLLRLPESTRDEIMTATQHVADHIMGLGENVDHKVLDKVGTDFTENLMEILRETELPKGRKAFCHVCRRGCLLHGPAEVAVVNIKALVDEVNIITNATTPLMFTRTCSS